MWHPTHTPRCHEACDDHPGHVDHPAPFAPSYLRLISLLRRVAALLLCTVLFSSSTVSAAPSSTVAPASVGGLVAFAIPSLAKGTLALGTLRTSTRVGTVTAYRVNVRGGPGTNYHVITTVRRGTTATVLDQAGRWYRIRLADGRTGWVSSAYVSVGGAAHATPPGQGGVTTARRTMLPNGWLTDRWGSPRSGGRIHEGEDLSASPGSPVFAPAHLTIYSNTWSNLGGWSLSGRDALGRRWYFAHFQSRSWVPVGSTVAKGQVIGYVGSTGNATGPHLHYGVTWPGGTWANPVDVLRSYPDVR